MKNKKSDSSVFGGILLIIACIEIVAFILIAQHLYPNYSLANNYISDLGVGSTSLIFNSAIQLFGILLLFAAYFIYKTGKHNLIAASFAIIGLGGIGVGTFPETTGSPHIISAFITFGGTAFAAVGTSRILKGYLSYYSLLSGLLGIGVLALFIVNMATGLHITFGLGKGGVEEVLFYNELLWALVVGISFIKGKL